MIFGIVERIYSRGRYLGAERKPKEHRELGKRI